MSVSVCPDVLNVESEAVLDRAVNVLTTSQAICRDGSCHQIHQAVDKMLFTTLVRWRCGMKRRDVKLVNCH